MTERDSCAGSDFCQELTGAEHVTFHRVYNGSPPGRILARGSTLALLADMSPLTRGHLLLIPTAHYVSFGAVMCDHAEDVATALKRIIPLYTASFGDPVFLEHGSTMGMEGSACVTHAHIHLLPLPFRQVNALMARDGLVSTTLGGLADLEQFGYDDRPYFYCGDTAEHQVYAAVQARPRQYLRSVAGRILGIPDPEWDYAVVVRKDLLTATMKETARWRLSLP
ncbi:HIT family protein [Spirillospora sp. NPDC048824]|uniref:HIT family protein n=1 Tax=Spirillospora sp. NPDC048824 TaxID=3364526 RepID=UPI003710A857